MNREKFINNLGTYYKDPTVSYYDQKAKCHIIGFVGKIIDQFFEKNDHLSDKYAEIFKKTIERHSRKYRNAPGICEIKEIAKEFPDKRKPITKIENYLSRTELQELFKKAKFN